MARLKSRWEARGLGVPGCEMAQPAGTCDRHPVAWHAVPEAALLGHRYFLDHERLAEPMGHCGSHRLPSVLRQVVGSDAVKVKYRRRQTIGTSPMSMVRLSYHA